MKRIDLLREMSFGVQVAEDEVNALAGYFVETNQWARIAKGDIDIIRGEKGAGKSAIYSLLMTRADTFFDQGILLVAAENPRGATVFKDLIADPPTTENEFVVLWKLYILTIIAQQLREYDIRGAKVRDLVMDSMSPTSNSIVWNGRDNQGAVVRSGVYIYKITSGKEKVTGTVVVAR